MDVLSPNQEPKRLSVGEEFVSWAEAYWRLEEHYSGTTKKPSERGGEGCPYEAVKAIFIKKIDDMLRDRLQLH